MSRDIPRKVIPTRIKDYQKQGPFLLAMYYIASCPTCDKSVKEFLGGADMYKIKYCYNCGQRLDWSYIKEILDSDFEKLGVR